MVKTTEPVSGHVSRSGRSIGSRSSVQDNDPVVLLHRTIGNQAVQRLFESGVIQAKLGIGAPNDKYEQEADRVADQIMRMQDSAIGNQQSAIGKGKEGESIQMKPG